MRTRYEKRSLMYVFCLRASAWALKPPLPLPLPKNLTHSLRGLASVPSGLLAEIRFCEGAREIDAPLGTAHSGLTYT
jgi:hypothetical protein